MLPGINVPPGLLRTLGGGLWTSAFSSVLSIDSTGWSGFDMRQLIDNSLLSVSGTNVRLTLKAAASGGCSIDALYIGHQAGAGDAYDFDGGQVQVTVGASGSFTIATGGTALTDDIPFAFDHTKNFIIAAHFNTTSAILRASLSGATNYFKSAANETSTANVSGYTLASSILALVSKIEVHS